MLMNSLVFFFGGWEMFSPHLRRFSSLGKSTVNGGIFFSKPGQTTFDYQPFAICLASKSFALAAHACARSLTYKLKYKRQRAPLRQNYRP